MPMTANDRETALKEATGWFARLRNPAMADGERAAFEAWCERSLANRRAYEEISGLWDAMDMLEPVSIPGLRVRKSPRRYLPLAAALAAFVLAGAVLFSLLGLAPWSYEHYATGPGEQRTLLLADGTTIYMNTKSRIFIALDKGKRRVRLREGEAIFDVARDEQRPFLVDAGMGRIRVLGTRFQIRRFDKGTDVAVIEGHVAVSAKGDEGTAELHAGEAVTVGPQRLGATRNADIQMLTAWRNGHLIYRGTPLHAVIADLNRYLADEVRIGDPAIGDLAVTAVVRIEDRDRILSALGRSLPIEAVTLPNGITMLYDARPREGG
ncbi:MAG: FecR domain-containing protein [Rhodothalassiaceae bacterium]